MGWKQKERWNKKKMDHLNSLLKNCQTFLCLLSQFSQYLPGASLFCHEAQHFTVDAHSNLRRERAWERESYDSHFTEEETEAQGSQSIFSKHFAERQSVLESGLQGQGNGGWKITKEGRWERPAQGSQTWLALWATRVQF